MSSSTGAWEKRTKAERQLKLLICLMSTNRYVTANYIRHRIGAYDPGQSDDSFNKMFERDKKDLRELGIPLVTGRGPSDDVEGYRVPPDQYALPDIPLDDDESAAVAMANASWRDPDILEQAQTALLKLRAVGVDLDAPDVLGFAPGGSARSMGAESVVISLSDAISRNQPVRFTHRSGVHTKIRHLEPWGVVKVAGRWYVAGHDLDRGEPRTFRISRISGVAADTATEPTATRPPLAQVQQMVADAVASAAGNDGGTARIWVAAAGGAGLRRIARAIAPAEYGDDAGDVLDIEITSRSSLIRMILSAGSDAVVLEPADLRSEVIEALDVLAAEFHGAQPATAGQPGESR